MSNECKPYFSDFTNHYLLAKFKDSSIVSDELTKHNQDKMSFMFNIDEDFFRRVVEGDTNFVSIYYLEYGDDYEGLQDIANILLKREKIAKAALGNMKTFCSTPPKFTFPYSDNIIVVEVASEKSHQSLKKYCEHTRRDANRKGVLMTNIMSLSILEELK